MYFPGSQLSVHNIPPAVRNLKRRKTVQSHDNVQRLILIFGSLIMVQVEYPVRIDVLRGSYIIRSPLGRIA